MFNLLFSGAGNFNVRDIFVWLYEFGITDVWAPFTIVFVVIFAFLDKVAFFSSKKSSSKNNPSEVDTKKRAINVFIALSFALLFVTPHALESTKDGPYDLVSVINRAIPNVILTVVAITMVFLVLALFGIKRALMGNDGNKPFFRGVIMFVMLGIILLIFFNAVNTDVAGWLNLNLQNDWFVSFLIPIVIFFFMFFIVIYFVVHDKTPPAGGSGEGEVTE